jgi:lysophospholipase L1-like esterase
MLAFRWRSLPTLIGCATLCVGLACSTQDANGPQAAAGAAGSATSATAGAAGSSATASAGAGGSAQGGSVPASGGDTAASGAGAAAGGSANGGSSGQTGGGSPGGSGGGGPGGSGGGSPGGSGGSSVGGAGGSAGSGGAAGGGGVATYDPCPTDGSPCKIMPFGDSITDGYNADTPGGYRVELFRLAHSAGKNITFVGSGQNGPAMVDGVAFPNKHEGHSGWTIAPAGGRSGISTLVANVMPQHKPHIVLLMIGTNDAIDNYEMAKAPERLGALIDSIYAQLPSALLLVAQPIPGRDNASKGDDAGLSARVKTFNDALPLVIKQRSDAGKHIALVDMYTPFAPNKANLLEDQWHPNAAGYVLIAKQWWTALEPLL